MRAIALGLLFATSGCVTQPPSDGKSAPAAARGVALSELKPAEGALSAQLATEAGKAEAQHLKPFAFVSATWCGPCNALKHSLGDPRMVDAFAGAYIIKLDADQWNPQLPGAGIPAPAIPVFFQLDSKGKPTGRKIDGSAWNADTVDDMAPVLKRFFNG